MFLNAEGRKGKRRGARRLYNFMSSVLSTSAEKESLYYSLLISHYSLLITYYLLLITHSPFP
jgi:hypothetical protein